MKIFEYYKYEYETIDLTENQHIENIRNLLINSIKKDYKQ